MWLCVCENIMKHFTTCNIQFPECRRLTIFSCVMTILTSWKGLCGYDRDDMSCQEFCTVSVENFSVPLLHLWEACDSCCPAPICCIILFSYIYVMISLIGNTVVRVLLHSVDRKSLQFPLIVHYFYMSCGASTKTIYVFLRLWSMGFKLLEKHNLISLSNAPIFIYKRCRTLESL